MADRRAFAATYRQSGDLPDALGDPVDILQRALLYVVTIGDAHASAFRVLDAYDARQLQLIGADPLRQFAGYPTTVRRILANHRMEGFLRVDGALRRLRSAVSRMEAAANSASQALALPLMSEPWDAHLCAYNSEVRHAFYEAVMAMVRLDGVRQEAEAALPYVRILLRMD
jgi:hypothetical protein